MTYPFLTTATLRRRRQEARDRLTAALTEAAAAKLEYDRLDAAIRHRELADAQVRREAMAEGVRGWTLTREGT